MTRYLLLFFLLPIAVFASYCGKSGVPYSFEVLPSGAPVLGCAQPSCVVSPEDFQEDSEFLTDVNGQADGFFREGDRKQKRYRHESAPKLVANCSGGFSQLSCPRKNQWVGGIEYIDHPRQPLILQCCSFEGLRFSQEVGMTVVGPGEAITGGEVIRNGRQISFDVIANVRKIVQPGHGHKASYEVTVRRMNCLPDPPEPEVGFDKEVPSEVLKVLSTAKNGKDLGTKEKFEKIAKKKNKKSKDQNPQQHGAKQFAAESENSINVDPIPNSNIELLPSTPAPQQPASSVNQQQAVPPVDPQQPVPQVNPQQPQPLPAHQVTQTGVQSPFQPQQVQPVPVPGFGAPPAFPGFPPAFGAGAAGFPPAATPSPFGGFPTFAPYGVTQAPPAPQVPAQGSTSTWDTAVREQPPRPTFPNGVEVFPTVGTAFMTPAPAFPTFPTAPQFAAVTPGPVVPARPGVPDQVQLPSLASPPPLPNLEQTVRNEGTAAAISRVDGGISQPVAASGAQTQAASNVAVQQPIGGQPSQSAQSQPVQPQQPQGFQPQGFRPQGFQPQGFHPQGFQPFTFPPPAHPFQFPSGFQFPSFPAVGGAGSGPAATLPTLPPFSFPTLPPPAATTPHPLFTLPTPAPSQQVQQPQQIQQPQQPQVAQGQQQPQPAPPAAQAQGTLLFPGLAPIQFPGLGPIAGSSQKK